MKILSFGLIGTLLLIGIFVWPGIYHYDKLDQKLPVKINRITGETLVLTEKGWVKLGKYKDLETKSYQTTNIDNSVKSTEQNQSKINYDKYLTHVVNSKAEGDGVFVYVTGEIEYKGTKQTHSIRIQATLYDESGVAVGSGGETIFSGLTQNELYAFRIPINITNPPTGPWKNFKIEIK